MGVLERYFLKLHHYVLRNENWIKSTNSVRTVGVKPSKQKLLFAGLYSRSGILIKLPLAQYEPILPLYQQCAITWSLIIFNISRNALWMSWKAERVFHRKRKKSADAKTSSPLWRTFFISSCFFAAITKKIIMALKIGNRVENKGWNF